MDINTHNQGSIKQNICLKLGHVASTIQEKLDLVKGK